MFLNISNDIDENNESLLDDVNSLNGFKNNDK